MPNVSTTSQSQVPSGRQQQHQFPSDMGNDQSLQSFEAAVDWVREYGRANPESLALWCLGIGFVLGWKLKPW